MDAFIFAEVLVQPLVVDACRSRDLGFGNKRAVHVYDLGCIILLGHAMLCRGHKCISHGAAY